MNQNLMRFKCPFSGCHLNSSLFRWHKNHIRSSHSHEIPVKCHLLLSVYFGMPKKKTKTKNNNNIKTRNKNRAQPQQCWRIASAYECLIMNTAWIWFGWIPEHNTHAEFIINNSDWRIHSLDIDAYIVNTCYLRTVWYQHIDLIYWSWIRNFDSSIAIDIRLYAKTWYA